MKTIKVQIIATWPTVKIFDESTGVTIGKKFSSMENAKREASWLRSCIKKNMFPENIETMHGYSFYYSV